MVSLGFLISERSLSLSNGGGAEIQINNQQLKIKNSLSAATVIRAVHGRHHPSTTHCLRLTACQCSARGPGMLNHGGDLGFE